MHTPVLATPNPVSDAALIERMAHRDATALIELQRRHWGSLYAQVYGILRDARRADRVVAEVFEHVWYGVARTNQRRPGTLAWLRDLARELARANVTTAAPGNGLTVAPRNSLTAAPQGDS